MALYDFSCAVCRAEKELQISMKDAPKVGERYEVPSNTLACTCGCRAFVRVMEKTPSNFRMNFRKTGI